MTGLRSLSGAERDSGLLFLEVFAFLTTYIVHTIVRSECRMTSVVGAPPVMPPPRQQVALVIACHTGIARHAITIATLVDSGNANFENSPLSMPRYAHGYRYWLSGRVSVVFDSMRLWIHGWKWCAQLGTNPLNTNLLTH